MQSATLFGNGFSEHFAVLMQITIIAHSNKNETIPTYMFLHQPHAHTNSTWQNAMNIGMRALHSNHTLTHIRRNYCSNKHNGPIN